MSVPTITQKVPSAQQNGASIVVTCEVQGFGRISGTVVIALK